MKLCPVTIVAPHELDDYTDAHYDHVMGYMVKHGPPVIRAWRNWPRGYTFTALEGSHRLSIAVELDYPIIIRPYLIDDIIATQDVVKTFSWTDARNIKVRKILDTMDNWEGKRPKFTLMAFIEGEEEPRGR